MIDDAAAIAEKAAMALKAAASSADRWAEIRDDLHSSFPDNLTRVDNDRIRRLHNEIEGLAYAAGDTNTLDSPSREYIYVKFRRSLLELCSEFPEIADRVSSISRIAMQRTAKDNITQAPAASLRLSKSDDTDTWFQINVDIAQPEDAESIRSTSTAPIPRSALLANMRMEFYGDRTPTPLSSDRLGIEPVLNWTPALLRRQIIPPVDLLPAKLYGRDGILTTLETLIHNPDGQCHALTGKLGVGKSTVALALAKRAIDAGLDVWWIQGSADIIDECMIALAGQLGVDPVELAAARAGRRSVHDLVWQHLEDAQNPWLLIFDGVDDPSLISRAATKRHGYGWIRPGRKGLVLVSGGSTDFVTGQRHTVRHLIGPIGQNNVENFIEESGINLSEAEAEEWKALVPYLSGSPFALNIVARYLSATSEPKEMAGSSVPAHAIKLATKLAEIDLDEKSDPANEILHSIFKWLSTSGSLDALLLLGQISYYAPDVAFPIELLDREILLETGILGEDAASPGFCNEVFSALQALRMLGLAEVRSSQDKKNSTGFLIVHPLISRIWRELLADQSSSQLARVTTGAAKILESATRNQPASAAEYQQWYFLIPHLSALICNLSSHSPLDAIDSAVRATTYVVHYLTRTGAYQSAVRLGRAAISLGQSLGEENNTRLEMEMVFAKALILRGSVGEAHGILNNVLDVRQRTLGFEDPATLDTLEIIALLLQRQGRLSRAELSLRQVIKGRQRREESDLESQVQPMSDLSRVLRQRGKLGEAERFGRQVRRIRRQINGPDSAEFFESAIDLATTLLSLGNLNQAQTILRSVLKAREHILGPEHPDTIDASVALAQALRALGRLDESEKMLQKAVQLYHIIAGRDHLDSIDACAALAQVLRDKGRLPDAEKLLRDVLADRQRLLGADHPQSLNAMLTLGVVLNDTGQLDAAEALLRELISKYELTAEPEDPTLLGAYHNLGAVLQNKGLIEESEKHYRMVLTVREWSLGSNHPETLSTLANLGSLLRLKGLVAESEQMLDQAKTAYVDLLGEHHPYTLTVKTNIASVYVDSGRPREAAQAYREILEVQKTALGNSHPDTLLTRVNLAIALGECADLASAEVLLKSAVRSYRGMFDARHPNLLTSRYQLARVLERQGKLTAALAEYQGTADLMAGVLGERHVEAIAAQLAVSRVLLALGRVGESHEQYVRAIRVAADTNIQRSSLGRRSWRPDREK